MAVLRGKFAVTMQHLRRRLDLLGIARPVRGDLGRARSLAADLLQVRLDLFAARARCLKVLRAVALDLRLAMHYGSNIGRFMSPDWDDADRPNSPITCSPCGNIGMFLTGFFGGGGDITPIGDRGTSFLGPLVEGRLSLGGRATSKGI